MMQKMKKTQRSYSSFRVKTQQAEINDQNDTSWMASNNGQKILKHLNHKISTSQLVNNQNDGLYQSVSQRIFQPRTNHYSSCMDNNMQVVSSVYEQQSLSSQQGDSHQANKSEKVIQHLREKCKNYEKALQFFNRERQQANKENVNSNRDNFIGNRESIKLSRNFNYSEQYYLKEIEELKKQLLSKDNDMEKYKQLYTTKSSQIEGISSEISERIEKQTTEKNLYIKELNMRNIEVKKLNEKLQLFTSELQTKDVVIMEKEEQIEGLEKQLQLIGSKKVKIEGYEQKIFEAENKLREIEVYTLRLKEELERKDLAEKQKSEEITKTMGRIQEYQQKLKMIENSFVEQLQKNSRLQSSLQQVKEQFEKTKNEYLKLSSLKQLIKEKQCEIRTLHVNVEDLKKMGSELLVENERLRQELELKEKCELKAEQYEQEVNAMKKLLREKDDVIMAGSQLKEQYQHLQAKHFNMEQQLHRFRNTLEQKDKTVSSLQGQILSLQSSLTQIQQQLVKCQVQLQKTKQRTTSIDQLYKENQRLNSSIHEKLNEIERLQQRINTLENKMCNLTNENSKVKVHKEELATELLKTQSVVENISRQLDAVKSYKNELEEQLTIQSEQMIKLTHQLTAYKATINQLQEENVRICNQANDMQEIIQKNKEELEELELKLQEYQQQRAHSEQLINHTNSRLIELNDQVVICKRMIDELLEKEHNHKDMIHKLGQHIERLEGERNHLLRENKKLSTAVERIFAISAEVKHSQSANE